MIAHKQAFNHDPENGVYGDCHRTAIASILNINPSDVPHFGEIYWGDGDAFNAAVNEYLISNHGLTLISIPFNGELDGILTTMGRSCPDVYYILGGKSSRGFDHSVVCLGNQIVNDPAMSNGEHSIIGPMSHGFYEVDIFTPFYKGIF